MRVVIGAVFTAIMGCVFTLITAVIFVIQHLFASLMLAGLARRCRGRDRAPPQGRRSQPGSGYPAGVAGPQLPPASRWAAPEMSSAVSRRRCLPSLPPGRCLP